MPRFIDINIKSIHVYGFLGSCASVSMWDYTADDYESLEFVAPSARKAWKIIYRAVRNMAAANMAV